MGGCRGWRVIFDYWLVPVHPLDIYRDTVHVHCSRTEAAHAQSSQPNLARLTPLKPWPLLAISFSINKISVYQISVAHLMHATWLAGVLQVQLRTV